MKRLTCIICGSIIGAMSFASTATPPAAGAPPLASVDGSAKIKFDSDEIAQAVSKTLAKPEQFNFESVSVTSIETAGGNVTADLSKSGNQVNAKIKGDTIFKATVKGSGGADSKLHMVYTLSDLDATVDLGKGQAEVDAVLRVQSLEGTRMWTRAKHQKTSPWSRVTFRITAIPRPFDVRLKLRLLVKVEKDGSVVLVPRSWAPQNKSDKIDIKISGQKLPDGEAKIEPLDVESVKVDMDIPFGAGDRTIPNPLVRGLEKVMGREFTLGKLPK